VLSSLPVSISGRGHLLTRQFQKSPFRVGDSRG